MQAAFLTNTLTWKTAGTYFGNLHELCGSGFCFFQTATQTKASTARDAKISAKVAKEPKQKFGPHALTLLLAFMCVTGNHGSLLCRLVLFRFWRSGSFRHFRFALPWRHGGRYGSWAFSLLLAFGC
jgi:hypothetical protein